MVQIPQPTVTMDDIVKWDNIKKEMARLKNEEAILRSRIFGHYFPDPTEGTNTADLNGGWVIKGKHVINRSVDVAALTNLTPLLREKGYNVDKLIRYKPELSLTEYKKLSPEQQCVFDQVLTIKEGSCGLEIVLPAANKPADGSQS